MKFIAIDSSLAHTGIAYGSITLEDTVVVVGTKLIETKKTKNKQVRASSDTIERCRATIDAIHKGISEWQPKVIFVETPSGSQNASGMKSYGTTCAIIACIKPPAIEVTPHEVKMCSVGNKKASKKDMIEWANKKYPEAGWYFHGGKLQNKNEHIADAIAVAHAGVKTNEYIRLVNLIN